MCTPSLCLQSFAHVVFGWRKWGDFSANTSQNVQPFFCYSFLLFLIFSLSLFQKNYPDCPLISPASFFPGWKHCHPFSLHCPPFPLLSVSNDYPGGNWARQQYASGEPGGEQPKTLLLYLLPPSTSSPILCCPITPPTHSTPVPTEGGGRAPSPSQRNFPVEIYTNFRDFKFYLQRVKNWNSPLSSSVHSPFFPLFCLLLSLNSAFLLPSHPLHIILLSLSIVLFTNVMLFSYLFPFF